MEEEIIGINGRVKTILDVCFEGTQSRMEKKLLGDFEEIAQIEQQTISALFTRSGKKNKFPAVPIALVQRIGLYMPEINLTWLLLGEGEMLLSKNKENTQDSPSLSKEQLTHLAIGKIQSYIFEALLLLLRKDEQEIESFLKRVSDTHIGDPQADSK